MKLLRWFGLLGCLGLLAAPAQAQPTVCTFTGAATDTNYTPYTTQAAMAGQVFSN